MIRMMMASIGGRAAAPSMQAQWQALMFRKALGFAIVASGFAVIAAQALQHALGG
ncbi:hypothetical protein OKW30_003186 [Paraburkholderia sp. Clong3]|uniref:hypothetical protein n=1 Tax=unclassified Paraburkholderia TaxID=2615204 RepID=UPI001617229E|nr:MULTISPECIES: hypothetical protein [unclassified Paraburkholderia]MBB5410746.1 hypothetical protein [Paraburkholderia sp. HC6.4b]MBB5452956.1 hypothetical protein [Paraburkholderia sp. Kb1A]MBB5461322.1 hypothetical protein [Paraburkholderia sp. Cpub6]MBB5466515.1 hypothetical protein [Paraburkholderia sp. CI2]